MWENFSCGVDSRKERNHVESLPYSDCNFWKIELDWNWSHKIWNKKKLGVLNFEISNQNFIGSHSPSKQRLPTNGCKLFQSIIPPRIHQCVPMTPKQDVPLQYSHFSFYLMRFLLHIPKRTNCKRKRKEISNFFLIL